MSTVSYPHIELSSNGVAFLEGTPTRVVEIALDRLSHHWDAEEIQRQHPHLTLGQIYAALAFYHDHREAFDKEIAEQLRDVDIIAARQGASLLHTKLVTFTDRWGDNGHRCGFEESSNRNLFPTLRRRNWRMRRNWICSPKSLTGND